MVWALARLEGEQPISWEEPPDFLALLAAPPAQLQLRFRSYRDGNPQQLVAVPMELLLRADDAEDMLELTIEPAVDLHPRSYASLVAIADRINRLGDSCVTWYDPERERLVIRSRMQHMLELGRAGDPQQAAAIQKQWTGNWLTEAVDAAVQASLAVARHLAIL